MLVCVLPTVFYLVDLVSGIVFLTGTKYQELQVTALADLVEFSQPAPFATNWDTAAEQPDGTVVTYAFPNATCLPVSSGL